MQSPAASPGTESPQPRSVAPGFHLGYRPALDGLRGVAILLVLATHDAVLTGTFGFIGVDIFFVLSGFLISTLLLEEWQQRRDISLMHFYIRRGLRLLPALVVMLIIFTTYAHVVMPPRRALKVMQEALRALFYCSNWAQAFHVGRSELFTHTWSLSLEEQFYFLWPAILLFALRKTDRRSILNWVVLAAFLSWLARVGLFFCGTQQLSGNVYGVADERLCSGLDTRADSLLIGCAIAIALSCGVIVSVRWRRRLGILSPCCAIMIALLGYGLGTFHPWMICVGWFAVSLFTGIILLQLLVTPKSLMHRALENRALVYIGKISYGLYVWHFPLLRTAERHHWPGGTLAFLAPTILVALASYYLLEAPCLRLKRRFARV